MPEEIYPSSYRCDCGHVAHFCENTITEIKQRSQGKKPWLTEGAGAEKHIVVFEDGKMSTMLCSKQQHHEQPAVHFTAKQGRYLAFIRHYTALHGRSPSEADMQQFFQVSAPAVHQMVLTLAQKGLVERTAGQARSVRVLVSAGSLPALQ